MTDAADSLSIEPSQCSVCRNFNCDGSGSNFNPHEDAYYKDFEKAAKDGCPFCSVIYHGIRMVVPNVSPADTIMWNHIQHPHESLIIEYWREAGGLKRIEFFRDIDSKQAWPVIGPANHLVQDIASEGISQMKKWLQDCDESHPACAKEDTPLPKRVLDVGNEKTEPFLYETQDKTGRYAALSHCWGEIQPLRTTSESIGLASQKIPLQSLPLTFQEAIQVCRWLEIKYLWIDALCIIQDNEADWVEHAANMGSIFENATLTIAATAALNNQQGLFHLVNERPSTTSLSVYQDDNPLSKDIYVRPTVLESFDRVHDHKNEPLFKRGWVLQEWLLSRRTLNFGAGEMTWECNTHASCECQSNTSTRVQKDRLMKTQVHITHLSDREGWPAVIEHYTDRRLTYSRDRLPALSGLMEKFMPAKASPSDYICGLWRSYLPLALLWSASSYKSERHERIDNYHAPSWSWASITGSIRFENTVYEQLAYGDAENPMTNVQCQLVEVQHELATNNPFGPARSGHLKLRGPIGSVSVTIKSDVENIRDAFVLHSPESELGKPLEGFTAIPDIEFPGYEVDDNEILEILTFVTNIPEYGFKNLEIGLLLKAVDRNQNLFRRVGTINAIAMNSEQLEQYEGWKKAYSAEKEVTII